MQRFNECLPIILDFEGGYVNHPNDRGGATNMGIIQREYDKWQERHGLPLQSVKEITPEEVAAIYKAEYWDACHCDDLPAPLELLVFDSAVQHGVRRASMWLQNVALASPDGVVGPKTILAAKTRPLEKTVADYIARRERFYQAIIDNDPSQKVFAKGWANRMAHLKAAIA